MKESVFKNDLLHSLTQKNCNFFSAETGEEAIVICSNHPGVDLIIIDIDLPVINGIETARRLKQVDERVTVILLVHYFMLETIRLAQSIGCEEILQTPVDLKAIEAIILKYLPCQ